MTTNEDLDYVAYVDAQWEAYATAHSAELEEQAFLEWCEREGLSWIGARGEAEARAMYEDYIDRLVAASEPD